MVVCGDEIWLSGGRRHLQNVFPKPPYDGIIAAGLNDNGEIAGTAVGAEDGANLIVFNRAFVWRKNRTVPLPEFPVGNSGLQPMDGVNTSVTGINTHGAIVGQASDDFSDEDDKRTRAFVYTPPRMVDLGPGTACGVNDNTQIAILRDPFHALVWQSDRQIPLILQNGEWIEHLSAINNSGQVIGQTRLAGAQEAHAMLWQHGSRQDLGTLGQASSDALGLNNWGQIVGKADVGPRDYNGEAPTHAFLWQKGKLEDLNSLISARSGWVLYSADAINNWGQIVGRGSKGAFLLTPVRR